MGITHHVQIRVSSVGMIGGSSGVDLDITLTSGTFDRRELTLASGDNTISIPTDAAGLIIIPPVANTQTLTLKGDAGDTGVTLGKTTPTYLSLPADGTDVIINAGAEIADCEIIIL